MRCSRRLRKRAMQSSLPWRQQPPQHPAFTGMPSQPIPNAPSVAITTTQTTVQPMVRSATDVAARTTLQPYFYTKEAEPTPLAMQAHHPNDDATSPAAGARLATPPDALPTSTAECLPTAPTILTTTGITRDLHPSATTRPASR